MSNRGSRRAFVGSSLALLTGTPLVCSETKAQNKENDPKPGYLIIYRPGPAFLLGKPLSEQPLKEHGRYMLGLYRKGTMRMAGGFADASGGAALIDAESLEEARAIAEADPAVIAKTFIYDLHPWQLVPWGKKGQ